MGVPGLAVLIQPPSDVAISPDGKTALVSIQNKSVLVELKIDGKNVSVTGRKFSVYGKPYRVLITPDGDLAITAVLVPPVSFGQRRRSRRP